MRLIIMRNKLRKERLSDVLPRMGAMQQDQAARNLEDALSKKLLNTVAKKVATHTLKVIREEIAATIKVTVNGKLDVLRKENNDGMKVIRDEIQDHNEKHEKDMVRLMPIIEAYESSKEAVDTAKRGGKVVIWITGAITGIGGAWLILKAIFPWL